MHTADSAYASTLTTGTLATATHAAAIDDLRSRSIVRLTGGSLSLLAHLILLLMIFWGGAQSGRPSLIPLFLTKGLDGHQEESQRRVDSEPIELNLADFAEVAPASRTGSPLPETLDHASATTVPEQNPNDWMTPIPTVASETEELTALPLDESLIEAPQPLLVVKTQTPRELTVEMSDTQKAMLERRITQGVQQLQDEAPSQINWADNGRSYTATLKLEPSTDSTELERVIAEITTTAEGGATLRTQLTMKRLAFSQFTQVVDRWDSEVQLHDDEIVGRFHSNSPVNLANDGATLPRFLGKVTTAARGFRMSSGGPVSRGAMSQLFQGGIETNTGRIELPVRARPVASELSGSSTHKFTFSEDTHIVFQPDGSYTWEVDGSSLMRHTKYDVDDPVYLVGARGIVLYVKGTVAGRVLMYSPGDIIIEGSLRYANDPRTSHNSEDYLGLVSDHDVEIARPRVTGSGDLWIDAAIFAGRRFNVTHLEYNRTAKLWIYGSMTTRTLSATEPRYSTRIEFDPRFDKVRPPGFPSTNRYEVADWHGQWNEVQDETLHP